MRSNTVYKTEVVKRIPGRVAIACSHCALDVPPGLVKEGAAQQFCCQGCATAYAVIHGCGLERYYKIRDQATNAPMSVKATGKRQREFDNPLFESLYVTAGADQLKHVELYLDGVHCAACVWLVERLPAALPGVIAARLDAGRALVQVTWDPAQVALSRIAQTLDSLGYSPYPARQFDGSSGRRMSDRRMLIRLGVAGACAGNAMLLGLALYAGAFATMDAGLQELFRWTSMGISWVAVAWPGSVFFRSAMASIRTRTPNLDLPIAIGLAAAAVWGTVNTIRGTGEIYFDSLAMLVFVLLIGRFVQQRQQRWTANAVELLFSFTPSSARKVEGDEVVEVPIEAVNENDLVEVLAGDSIPADGLVELGTSSVDQSLLTGESAPVSVGPGASVSAGAVNLSGPIRLRVAATGEATRAGRLMKMVEEATRRKAPIVRFADSLASWFVGGMLSLAAVTAVVWAFIDPSRAVDTAATVLIVTCPCALGLATPLAVTVAIGRAAQKGILVKGGDVLQILAGKGTMFLDKTGTLTQGRMSLVRWHGPGDIQSMVAALETESSHPIALALAAGLDAGNSPKATSVEQITGGGISGVVGNYRVCVGSASFVRSRVISEEPQIIQAEAACIAEGLTPVLVAIDGRIAAVAGLGDGIREDTAAAIQSFQDAGWKVRILSGDHPEIVASTARALGISSEHAIGGMSPEDKLQAVTFASLSGPIIMVGDGVNDSAALAAATVGISVRGGAEASMAAADVYLSRSGLTPIAELLGASRSTLRAIRIGLGVSLFYNGLAAALAVTGMISPLIAAILMPVSSLTVLTLAFKAQSFGGKSCR